MRRSLPLLLVLVPLAALAADNAPAPLPAEKAARSAVLPDGFRMSVFAAEPDVTQPISLTIDARGRVCAARDGGMDATRVVALTAKC